MSSSSSKVEIEAPAGRVVSEMARRAALHRQIGALTIALRDMPRPRTQREWIRAYRLRAKVRALEGQLHQLPLLIGR